MNARERRERAGSGDFGRICFTHNKFSSKNEAPRAPLLARRPVCISHRFANAIANQPPSAQIRVSRLVSVRKVTPFRAAWREPARARAAFAPRSARVAA